MISCLPLFMKTWDWLSVQREEEEGRKKQLNMPGSEIPLPVLASEPRAVSGTSTGLEDEQSWVWITLFWICSLVSWVPASSTERHKVWRAIAVHAFNPSAREARQVDLKSEFQDSYIQPVCLEERKSGEGVEGKEGRKHKIQFPWQVLKMWWETESLQFSQVLA